MRDGYAGEELSGLIGGLEGTSVLLGLEREVGPGLPSRRFEALVSRGVASGGSWQSKNAFLAAQHHSHVSRMEPVSGRTSVISLVESFEGRSPTPDSTGNNQESLSQLAAEMAMIPTVPSTANGEQEEAKSMDSKDLMVALMYLLKVNPPIPLQNG